MKRETVSELPEGERPMDRFTVGIPLVLDFMHQAGGSATAGDITDMLKRDAPSEVAKYAGQIRSEMKAQGLMVNPERTVWVLTARGRATHLLQPRFNEIIDALTHALENP
jgi:hypothetical protein